MQQQILISISPAELQEMITDAVNLAMSKHNDKSKDILIDQAAVEKRYTISKPTVIAWGKKGKLKPIKMGRRVYYKESELP